MNSWAEMSFCVKKGEKKVTKNRAYMGMKKNLEFHANFKYANLPQ
jgi:hypothetical protein